MRKEEEEFKKKPTRDQDIEDFNTYMSLKKDLDSESFVFYDLLGRIDDEILLKHKISIRNK